MTRTHSVTLSVTTAVARLLRFPRIHRIASKLMTHWGADASLKVTVPRNLVTVPRNLALLVVGCGSKDPLEEVAEWFDGGKGCFIESTITSQII